MAREEKTAKPANAKPLNEDAMKGVLVDGIGFHVGKDFVILEGVISKPRSETPIIVSRMIFPIEALEKMGSAITEILKKRKELETKGKSEKQ